MEYGCSPMYSATAVVSVMLATPSRARWYRFRRSGQLDKHRSHGTQSSNSMSSFAALATAAVMWRGWDACKAATRLRASRQRQDCGEPSLLGASRRHAEGGAPFPATPPSLGWVVVHMSTK